MKLLCMGSIVFLSPKSCIVPPCYQHEVLHAGGLQHLLYEVVNDIGKGIINFALDGRIYKVCRLSCGSSLPSPEVPVTHHCWVD